MTRAHTTLDEASCHGYFFNFLVRPRSIENNHRLMQLEAILNQFAHVNVLFSLLHKGGDDFDRERSGISSLFEFQSPQWEKLNSEADQSNELILVNDRLIVNPFKKDDIITPEMSITLKSHRSHRSHKSHKSHRSNDKFIKRESDCLEEMAA